MKRPYLVNFMAIESDDILTIKSSLALKKNDFQINHFSLTRKGTTPIGNIKLMSKHVFRIKIIGMTNSQQVVLNREYETDSFGVLELRIPLEKGDQKITSIELFETGISPGLSLQLGAFLPYKISTPKKIVITDFDKTLVDTVFSSASEVWNSLNSPITNFPTVQKSVDLLQEYISNDFQPFILSASPHFYEVPIRDWLYQSQLYAGNLFLKDYRNIFSLNQGLLRPKDMKNQGFYKLTQLTNILLMTGVPSELVLMGDGFESDEFIYLILKSVIENKEDPWKVWNNIKREKIFQFTTKQSTQFLTKFYKLSEMAKKVDSCSVDIQIRVTDTSIDKIRDKEYSQRFVQEKKTTVSYYLA